MNGPSTSGDVGMHAVKDPRAAARARAEHAKQLRDERARHYRREAYDLRQSARSLAQRLTVRTCGLWQSYGRRATELAGTIDLAIGPSRSGRERARVLGTHACGSVWECPVCHGRVCASRALEVTEFAREARDRGFTLRMVTLTLRHAWTDDLEDTSEVCAEGWRAVLQSRGVRELRARETWHMVRAMEVTHGANGWHPHLHVLIAVESPLQRHDADEHRRRTIEDAWMPACARIGEESNRPLEGIAVVQNPVNVEAADYLQKLGLEVADDRMKRSSGGRTPFEILRDARDGDVKSAELWRTYAHAMVGRKQLTWGHKVRKIFGLAVEPTDEDLAHERDDVPEDRVLVSMDATVYREAIGRHPGLLARVLDALELYGVGEALAEISSYHGSDEHVRRIIESHRWVTQARQRWRERQTGDPDEPRERSLFRV